VPRPAIEFLRETLGELGDIFGEFRLPSPKRTSRLDESLDRWFGGSRWRAKGDRLTLLGTDRSGGMFCLWWYVSLGDKRAPVVYLGSDGSGLTVLANSATDFIELLATGLVWEPGRFVDNEMTDANKVATFARRARAEYGFGTRSADAILEEGAHPDFAKWVRSIADDT
jgi:hypothetical protein